MKLWDLCVKPEPGTTGAEEREALMDFARTIKHPGTLICSAKRLGSGQPATA